MAQSQIINFLIIQSIYQKPMSEQNNSPLRHSDIFTFNDARTSNKKQAYQFYNNHPNHITFLQNIRLKQVKEYLMLVKIAPKRSEQQVMC